MSFASRITRQPLVFDLQTADDLRPRFAGPAADLIAASASCAPFLRDLITREGAWLTPALDLDPEVAFDRLMADLSQAPGDQLGALLRQAKRRVALLTGLADLGGVWDLTQVTTHLTHFADRAVQACLDHLIAEEIRRGKLPDAPHGMVVLAMGKMGAFELNYSSDIDLICLFDETKHPGTEMEARQAFIRVTRKMTGLLSDITAEGYVFRTDLRLRPDASVMPVCLSMASALAYYEAEGRTWERAAHIKARPCAGDIAAGQAYLKALTPFVWRRHLDYAAIQDAHDMRLRIRDHKGLNGPVKVEGHNVKLGPGGIREIEFFAQTRQLIAGGRDPSLRATGTEAALAALTAKGWLPQDVTADLTTAYRIWREVEHRLQMVLDEQTQTMPATPEGIARIAAFCGMAEPTFRRDFLTRVAHVESLTEGFFAPSAPKETSPDLTPQMETIVQAWSNYPALRSDRAQAIFARIKPGLLSRLMRAQAPQEALVALDGFLSGLPAGVQLFALFEANPALVDLIVDICATAPSLALYLSRNARVLDAVIGGSFFAPWPGREGLAQDLHHRLNGADYEQVLGLSRIWLKEWHFRVGVHHLRGLIDGFEAGKAYADLAEVVVAALWPRVTAEVARRHGPPPGRGAVVLGMGSLGAARLNAGSDLDLIVIYDADGAEMSEGPKPLATRPYYAKLTQAMITALTAQTPEGRLYEVDMRLRPSGRQGPVATGIASFAAYQRDEAWTWEHLALTRARVLAGPVELAAEVEGLRRQVLAEKGQGARVRADVAEMRARLAEAKPAQGPWEAKNGPGRLMDIELCAQTLALMAASPARSLDRQLASDRGRHLSQTEKQGLEEAARLFWQLQAAGRLLSDRALDPGALGEGARAFVLRETGAADAAGLTQALQEAAARAAAVIDRVMEARDDP
ncbi:glutamine-synthetase adenylyltransferase [Rhodobacter sp. KR11]|uniref:[protein-PII] uridylyltransferase family protein n=1 Tax=Rhodobacter sp. KR11 TaxID=2974588 RepID=UPI0022212D61|nr:glutamine-synthetase adenylyltransferase [Rhodobacter sp. KR11]MCW1917956.1 glutamine-synthetase adenylyltransferase [Rhodobacter sp. KR11]